jgi:hypothetical protein
VGVDQEQKLLYFRYFFVGRDDVMAQRKPDGAYRFVRAPLTNQMIIRHLRGDMLLGSYPLQKNGTTRWVAADFDNHNGNAFEEAMVLVKTLRSFDIEPLCNTSQSGKGVHVRVIFSGSRRDVMMGNDVQASVARRFMQEMINYAELKHFKDGGAFDRIFPNQDGLITEQSVGSQIAMPLNSKAAAERKGTMLLDSEFKLIPLNDASWDRIELYEWVTTGVLFDAVQSIGKYAAVYGEADESGKRVYGAEKDTVTIRQNNNSQTRNIVKADLDFMVENCNFIKSAASGTIPYSVWMSLASVFCCFDKVGGRGEFHRISSMDPGVDSKGHSRYDRAKADTKYDNILSTFKSPVRCVYLAQSGWKCPHLGDDDICQKFRFSDGRGPRTPATVHMFGRVRNSAETQPGSDVANV